MNNISYVTKASGLAAYFHDGQCYGPHPYTFHLFAVTDRVSKIFEKSEDLELLQVTAILHDILEDTSCTEDDIKECLEGYDRVDELLQALLAITKCETETRSEYIKRCKQNEVALRVKIADTFSNLEASVNISDTKRINKYTKQLQELYNDR